MRNHPIDNSGWKYKCAMLIWQEARGRAHMSISAAFGMLQRFVEGFHEIGNPDRFG